MTKKFCFIAVTFSVLMVFAIAAFASMTDYDKSGTLVLKQKVKAETVSEKPKEENVETKKVKLQTSMGDIIIELNEEAAPVTVKNFLRYIEEGFYDGTIFHRVIPSFMVQGGGFTADMKQKKPHEPIINEASNGLKNNKGTIAMARTNNPDSATSQFFINHKDNHFLNYVKGGNPGYTVFGKTIEGTDVVDAIAAVKTTRKGNYSDVPIEPVVINSAKLVLAEQKQK